MDSKYNVDFIVIYILYKLMEIGSYKGLIKV